MTGVTGDEELAQLATRLRQVGGQELVKELTAGLRAGVRPLSETIRKRSPEYTPAGYEQTFAASLRFTTSVRTTGSTASVQLIGAAKGRRSPRQIKEINKGRLKHPVYGRYRYNRFGSRRKNPWVRQIIRAGFWDDPVEAQGDDIRREMRDVMRRVVDKITKG